MNVNQQSLLKYSILVAGLKRKELLMIRLWMDGYTNKEIIRTLDLDCSQPALSKKLTRLKGKIRTSYLRLVKLNSGSIAK